MTTMTTAYVTHPDCLRHDMGAGHPECPERLASVNEAMRGAGLLTELRRLEAPLAASPTLSAYTTSAYVNLIFENAPAEGHSARPGHGDELAQPRCRPPRRRCRPAGSR